MIICCSKLPMLGQIRIKIANLTTVYSMQAGHGEWEGCCFTDNRVYQAGFSDLPSSPPPSPLPTHPQPLRMPRLFTSPPPSPSPTHPQSLSPPTTNHLVSQGSINCMLCIPITLQLASLLHKNIGCTL